MGLGYGFWGTVKITTRKQAVTVRVDTHPLSAFLRPFRAVSEFQSSAVEVVLIQLPVLPVIPNS